jgi:hypothetical protein
MNAWSYREMRKYTLALTAVIALIAFVPGTTTFNGDVAYAQAKKGKMGKKGKMRKGGTKGHCKAKAKSRNPFGHC